MPAPIRAEARGRRRGRPRHRPVGEPCSPSTSCGSVPACPASSKRSTSDPASGLSSALMPIHEYRHGSHTEAHRLMRRAVATGHPGPALRRPADDRPRQARREGRATSFLRDALTRPIPSDGMRNRMAKRLARRAAAEPEPGPDNDDPGLDVHSVVAVPPQLRPGREQDDHLPGPGEPRLAGTTRPTPSTLTPSPCSFGPTAGPSRRRHDLLQPASRLMFRPGPAGSPAGPRRGRRPAGHRRLPGRPRRRRAARFDRDGVRGREPTGGASGACSAAVSSSTAASSSPSRRSSWARLRKVTHCWVQLPERSQ